MRIVHISTSDSGGGAFRAAYRLHCGLKRLGHDSRMLVLRRGTRDESVIPLRPADDFLSRMRRGRRARRIWRDYEQYRASIPPGAEPFTDDRSAFTGEITRQLEDCDIINLHYAGELLDFQSFFAGYPKHIPLVWRMADMGVFTGGCHYTQGCKRFTDRCGQCPQLGSKNEIDLSRRIWLRKKRSLDQVGAGGLHIVGPSRWIAEQARRSSLLGGFPLSVIPNGLDTEEFAPREKTYSRDLWNIPREDRVLLFAAESLANPRKGFKYLADALASMTSTQNLLLVSVGGGKCELPGTIRHLPIGKINNDRMLSTLYSAADLFVIPSLEESFGQTVIEALACGTPVIGFNIGGIPDMVRPGQTGWLAREGDSAALKAAIVEALSAQRPLREIGQNCRRIAIEEYSLDVQASAYLSLYEKLLKADGKNVTMPHSQRVAGEQLSVP